MKLPNRNITLHIHLSIPSFIGRIGLPLVALAKWGRIIPLAILVFALYLLADTFGLNYLFVDRAQAAIPNSARIIPYQGILTNSSGNYVTDGNYSMVFAIYSVASAGTALWSETQTVAVTNGVFSVNIGSTDANGVNLAMDTPPYYLGVKIGTNAEMAPRILLAFSPFAFVAKNVDVAPPGVPAAGVMFFNLAACPSGWTELTAARGMYIVGLPAAGTLAGTSGTALTNLESRPVGQHLHSVDPSSTGVSISDPGHRHSSWPNIGDGNGNNSGGFTYGCCMGSAQTNWTSTTTTGISASVDIAAFNSANAGSVAGTNAPYIQLLACQKS